MHIHGVVRGYRNQLPESFTKVKPDSWAWKEQSFMAFGVTHRLRCESVRRSHRRSAATSTAPHIMAVTSVLVLSSRLTERRRDCPLQLTAVADGGGSQAALVSDGDRNLYGPTSYGGDLSCPAQFPLGGERSSRSMPVGKRLWCTHFIGYPTDGTAGLDFGKR